MVNYNWELVQEVNCLKEIIINDELNKVKVEKRELLELMLKKKRNESILVIMMNPSKADNNVSDHTINSIIDFFSQSSHHIIKGPCINPISKINKIFISNLFSIYNPKSKKLNESINKVIEYHSIDYLIELIESNHNKIFETVDEVDQIVLGWGDCPDNFHVTTYHVQITRVLDYLTTKKKDRISTFHIKNVRASRRGIQSENMLTNKKNPVHPINGEIKGLLKVDIDPLYRISPIIEEHYSK
ncbi:DUF1643 domain-containing protein [Bacillus zanthoxyli]|nr:DUF1643 domain-containing protein [Bacillus zanthoxyli]